MTDVLPDRQLAPARLSARFPSRDLRAEPCAAVADRPMAEAPMAATCGWSAKSRHARAGTDADRRRRYGGLRSRSGNLPTAGLAVLDF